jgi:hypothetical protein
MNNPMMFTDPSGFRFEPPQERRERELNTEYYPTPYWEGRYQGGYMNGGGGGVLAGWHPAGSGSIADIIDRLKSYTYGGYWSNGNYYAYKSDDEAIWSNISVETINNNIRTAYSKLNKLILNINIGAKQMINEIVDKSNAELYNLIENIKAASVGWWNPQGQKDVTFELARLWYQFGGGEPMNVNLKTIDFSRVSMSEMKDKLIEVNLDNPFKHMTNVNDALIFGTLYLYQENGNVFRAAYVKEINGRGDYYNFDVKWTSPKSWLFRNENTIFAQLINSLMPIGGTYMYVGGTSYPIYLYGTVTIKP